MKKKLLVIGSGSMGTAMAKVFYDANKVNVAIYGTNQNQLNDLKEGKNLQFFPKSSNIPKLNTYNDIKLALKDVDYVAIAVPSKVYDVVLDNILANLNNEIIIFNMAKGFYPKTEFMIHQGIENRTKSNKLIKGIISVIGPSHAEEIVNELPTTVVIVNEDKKLLIKVQDIFQTKYFRTYIQTDVKGAEVGVSYKNIIAIATGISSGLGYGINTTAAIITKGLIEIKRINKIMGGNDDTLLGLSGIGDLIVTATSELSRNFQFGKLLAKDKDAALKTTLTVEGFTSLKIMYDIGKKHNLELPIVEYLYDIVYNDIDPKDVVDKFFQRKLKSE